MTPSGLADGMEASRVDPVGHGGARGMAADPTSCPPLDLFKISVKEGKNKPIRKIRSGGSGDMLVRSIVSVAAREGRMWEGGRRHHNSCHRASRHHTLSQHSLS